MDIVAQFEEAAAYAAKKIARIEIAPHGVVVRMQRRFLNCQEMILWDDLKEARSNILIAAIDKCADALTSVRRN